MACGRLNDYVSKLFDLSAINAEHFSALPCPEA
jgi:hypothetical protein